MAIQAQLYPENLGLPLMGGNVSQDWFFNNQINNNFTNNNMCFNEISSNNNLQQQKYQQQYQFQQQQQEGLLQLQQQYLLQLQNQQQQQQRNSCDNNNNNNNDDEGFVFMSSSKNCTPTTTGSTTTTASESDYRLPMNISPSFAETLEKQRQEIDRFITLQNERLKLALQEQRKQQLTAMMRKLEARAKQLLVEKDEEIAKASKRRYELEEVIRKMQVENQEWQRIAAENEAMVVSLNTTLEQIKEQACCITSSSCSSNEVGDAESCCNEGSFGNRKRVRDEEETEEFEKTEEKKIKTGVICKVCKSGKSCILLLPCRHLCCCKGCVAFVDVCPVCKSEKQASVEALFS